jgi:phosphatidylserine/phosphatidylglycerophosphate/cardiolipin synthase-like enzyme
MHNKFFVLSKNDQPKAVWTGSTNLTENGIFGHSHLGHIVEDKDVAQSFLDYWDRLKWAMEKEGLGQPQEWQPQYLIDNDSWMKDYVNENDKSGRNARRKYFAGPMAV